jgi:hypothetical protein
MSFQVELKEKLQKDLYIVEFEGLVGKYMLDINPDRIFILDHLSWSNAWISTILIDDRFALLPLFGESLSDLFGTELNFSEWPGPLRQMLKTPRPGSILKRIGFKGFLCGVLLLSDKVVCP